MTYDPSIPDLEDELLARFILELDTATDRQAVVRKYAAQHPALADELAQFEEMNRTMAQAGGEGVGDAPKQLGEYRIIRQIAIGGMGVIYEAVQEGLNRRVAVKTIRRGRISAHARGRFFREQRVLARLHQTHIVPIHAAGDENDLLYFAMPFIEGVTLKRLVGAATTIDWRNFDSKTSCLTQLLNHVSTNPVADENAFAESSQEPVLTGDYFRTMALAVVDVAEAMEHAHHMKILHRDLKPSNIMIDRQGQCWIIDFGLAGYLGQISTTVSDSLEKEVSESLTTGNIIGTPQYMAPEQWRGEPATVATDVWGLGATLFELLALRRVFDGASNLEIRQKVLADAPTKPLKFGSNVPADLAAVCCKAIQKDPVERYPTAQALADDLRRWLRHEPVSARPALALRRIRLWIRRNPGWAAALSLLLATVLGLGWALFEAERHQSAETQLSLEQDRRRLADDTSRRQMLMPDLHRLRLGGHVNGWRREAMDKARKIDAIQPGKDVRDEAAAALVGLDVRPSSTFNLAASALAFDATGKLLLLGGTNDRYGKPKSGAQLIATNIVKNVSNRAGAGPVAFRADGTPCQLTPQKNDAGTVVLWDITRQQELSHFTIAPGQVPQTLTEFNRPVLALSADGLRAAASIRPDEESLYLWDTTTGKPLYHWKRACESLAFSPDAAFLAVGDKSGKITIYSLNNSMLPVELEADNIAITALAFGRDPVQHDHALHSNREIIKWQLASGNAGTRVIVWDLQTRQRRCHCDGAMYGVSSLIFSPDGMTLVSAGRSVVFWDAASGRRHLEIGMDYVACVGFDPSGHRLAVCREPTGANIECTQIWDVEIGRGTNLLGGLVGPVAKIVFSNDSRYVAALSQQWQVAVWNLSERRLLHIFDGPHGEFGDNAALAFDPHGERLACAGGTQVKMWEVESGHTLQSWTLPTGLQDALAFGSTGPQLWSIRCETTSPGVPPYSHADFKIYPRIYALRNLLSPNPTQITEIKTDDDRGKDDLPNRIVISPDATAVAINGIRMLSGTRQHTVRVFSLPDLSLKWRRSGENVYMDPTGRLVGYNDESDGVVFVDTLTRNIFRKRNGTNQSDWQLVVSRLYPWLRQRRTRRSRH